jgi:1-acyl-sn-glycerol-3-phosphate acyltransferase
MMIVNMARSRMNPLQCVLWVFAWLMAKYCGGERELPATSAASREVVGAILVVNHRSSVDPFFVQTCNRSQSALDGGARVLRELRHFVGSCARCEVIPVNRGGVDTQSTKGRAATHSCRWSCRDVSLKVGST